MCGLFYSGWAARSARLLIATQCVYDNMLKVSLHERCVQLSVLFAIVLLSGCKLADSGDNPRIVPMQAPDLVGEWIGFTPDEVFIYRIELKRGGEAKIGVLYSTNPIQIYVSESWSLSDGRICIPLSKKGEYESIEANGVVAGSQIQLTVRGEGGWLHNISMRREKALLERMTRLRQAMHQSD